MGSLEQLRNLVAEMFNKAEHKEDIESLTAIKTVCDEVEQEHNKLEAENKELLKDYKELITHTSFKDDRHSDNRITEEVSIDEALEMAIKNYKK